LALTPDKARLMLDTAELLCPAPVVSAAVARVAREITVALEDSFPLVLCVMRGAVVFAGQLLPQLRFPLEFDYVEVSRYGSATRGAGISWRVTPAIPAAGRSVLVLDDILDEGRTLAAVRDKLLADGASRVWIAVLADKDTGRAKPVRADFTGLKLPNRFVIGCGLDAGGAWRNLPEIYAVKEDLQ
jgi:hypoxanthine phosphoribosyltransferase